MTRKDYKALASALNYQWLSDKLSDIDSTTTIRSIAIRMCGVFADDNPRFDADRFMAAVFTK